MADTYSEELRITEDFMAGTGRCAEGMVYVPAVTYAYDGEEHPALCVDEHEFTNEDLARLYKKTADTVRVKAINSRGEVISTYTLNKEDVGKLSGDYTKAGSTRIAGVAGYIYEPVLERDAPISPKGFDGPQQPLVNVPAREIRTYSQKIPGAKEICEAQGKRLPTEIEWGRVASKNWTISRKDYNNIYYPNVTNKHVSRNVCETKGDYVEYDGKKICDLGGNVYEWLSDYGRFGFHASPYMGGFLDYPRVYDYDPWRAKVGPSGKVLPSNRDIRIGFRCVVAPQDSKK